MKTSSLSFIQIPSLRNVHYVLILLAIHFVPNPVGTNTPPSSQSDFPIENELLCAADFSAATSMAALNIPNKGLYVFRGDQYYKYQYIGQERTLLAGYPKKLPGGWKGLPDNFKSGIDAAVYYPPTKKIYFFKGNQYLRISGVTVEEGFPKKLPGGWSGLPAEFARDIDSAIYYEGPEGQEGLRGPPGQIILTKGNKYISFANFKIKVLNGNLKDIWRAKQMPVPFSGKIDAMAHKVNGFDGASPGTWFFNEYKFMSAPGSTVLNKGSTLEMAELQPTTVSDSRFKVVGIILKWGEVQDLKEWNIAEYSLGAPDITKIAADASVYIPELGSYIFVKDQYYKYTIDLAGQKKPKLWRDYPKKLPGGWKGLPDNFKKGVDAAFYYSPTKKTYMIKGHEYIRLSGAKVDPGFPKKLKGNWKGIPGNFASGIDAAFVLGANQKTYIVFVKNGYFIAFENFTKIASGKTKDLWKGMPAAYARNIDAITSGGFWGNYIFAREQVDFFPGHVANLSPSFSVRDVPGFSRGLPKPVGDDWKLAVLNRPKKAAAEGIVGGVKVKLLPPNAKDIASRNPNKDDSSDDGEDYDCSIKHYTEKLAAPENILLDPTTDVIYPGAIIDGASIPTGEYRLLNYPRNNYAISTNIEATKGSVTITEPLKQSHVREAVKSIIRTIPKAALSGKQSMQTEEMYSGEHFRLKFGGHYNSGVVNVSSDLEISSRTTKNRIVIEYVQELFTMDMENPGGYKSWIKDPSKINFYKTIPMYVASVKYGRRAYMSIESSESMNSLKTNFSGAYMSAGASLNNEQKRILKTSKVKVYIIGGDGKNAAGAATGDPKKFMNYIANGTGSSITAMPIAYKLRFLENDAVAKVSLSSNYTVRNCTAYQRKWRVHLKRLVCTGVDDSGNNEELYGMAWVDFYDKNGKHLNSRDNKIWHRTVDQYVSLGRNSPTLNINSSNDFEYTKAQLKKNRPGDNGAYIILRGWVEEDDDTNSNDDLGRINKKIYLNEITNGLMDEIQMDGFADGGSKATLVWSIETF